MGVLTSKEVLDEFNSDFPGRYTGEGRLVIIDGQMVKNGLEISPGDRLTWIFRECAKLYVDPTPTQIKATRNTSLIKLKPRAGYIPDLPEVAVVIGPRADLTWPEHVKNTTGFDQRSNFASTIDQDQLHRYIYDHELGHAAEYGDVSPTNKDKVNYRECVADAYAMLRHRQRFGFDSDFPQQIQAMRSFSAFLGDVDHDTADAIVLAERYANTHRNNFQGMAPSELLEVAKDIARNTALTPEQIELYKKEKVRLNPSPSGIKATIQGLADKAETPADGFIGERRNQLVQSLRKLGEMVGRPDEPPATMLAHSFKLKVNDNAVNGELKLIGSSLASLHDKADLSGKINVWEAEIREAANDPYLSELAPPHPAIELKEHIDSAAERLNNTVPGMGDAVKREIEANPDAAKVFSDAEQRQAFIDKELSEFHARLVKEVRPDRTAKLHKKSSIGETHTPHPANEAEHPLTASELAVTTSATPETPAVASAAPQAGASQTTAPVGETQTIASPANASADAGVGSSTTTTGQTTGIEKAPPAEVHVPPEIHTPEIHAPEIHAPEVHGRGGVIGAAVMGVAVTGAALLNGASPAQAALSGGKTIIDGAVPGASEWLSGTPTQQQSLLDKALNWADTATGTVATGAAVTAAVTSPLALTGLGAAVPAGATIVAGAAGIANGAVGLISDGLTYAGFTNRGGLIHGGVDLAQAYVDGAKRQLGGTEQPDKDNAVPPTNQATIPILTPETERSSRGAMRSIIAKQNRADGAAASTDNTVPAPIIKTSESSYKTVSLPLMTLKM